MIKSFSLKQATGRTLPPTVLVVGGLLLLAAVSARADWPNTNGTKWVQFPDPRGLDVLAAQPAAGAQALIVADDFRCVRTGPISDVHIWTSWLGDTPNPNLPITLAIWTDVPAITNGPVPTPSHPGSMIWHQTFGPGDYAIRPTQTADEQFWNPDPAPFGNILGPDHVVWQYNFYLFSTNGFTQQGSPATPVVYWLSMTAGYNVQAIGWKTSTNHWIDNAVFGHLDAVGTPVGDWKELFDPRDPTNPKSLDLAFALTMPREIPNPPPPPTNKWVQYPDQFNGYDVRATFPLMVADDFQCTNAGTITNIQVWASWKDDAPPDTTMSFTLAIWSDISAGGGGTTGANPFSRPGNLLWTETFTPGSYGIRQYTNGTELFYDPETGEMLPETRIWLYNFNPKRPFCQKGSRNLPITYWLSICGQSPTAGFQFGWKTSTNHWNDDAVYGHVTAAGGPVGDWKDLHDPRTGVSLDMAFRLNDGPPNDDCQPIMRPKFFMPPDLSTNGLDVQATFPKILGDDFLCRVPGPINALTVWGSWLNDKVDSNAVFQVALWTDVPHLPGTPGFSHPGVLLCSNIFYPPTAVGTSLLRYNYRLDRADLRENFYDPDTPGGFIGNDTQIWRYDFYPFLPSCWRQVGLPARPRTYWMTVSYLQTLPDYLFGWKTSTNHWSDDGVWGHMDAARNPLGDWKDLHDPRDNQSLDLSFAVRTFPVVGINKDLRNMTPQTPDGVQIVVLGLHEVTWHYDDAPPWPNFSASQMGGNTVLTWSGKPVPPGAITHVGFEMGGTTLTILQMNWLLAGAVIGTPYQVNHHMLGNGNNLVLINDIVGFPVTPLGGVAEFFAEPTPLDQMNPNGQRDPLATMPLPIQPMTILPGGAMRIPLPPGPSNANYVMFMLNLGNDAGQPATMDFIQLPLDMALRPIIQRADLMNGQLILVLTPLPGRSYRLQMTADLGNPAWADVQTGDLNGDAQMDEVRVMVPLTRMRQFYRLLLIPE